MARTGTRRRASEQTLIEDAGASPAAEVEPVAEETPAEAAPAPEAPVEKTVPKKEPVEEPKAAAPERRGAPDLI